MNALNDKEIDTTCAELGVELEKTDKLKQLQASKIKSEQEIKDFVVSIQPQMTDFIDLWENTPMYRMTLTSVGIAIAHANIQMRTGEFSPLSTWM